MEQQEKKRQPRRVIQMQVIPNGDGSHTVYALCNDGRLWFKLGSTSIWTEVNLKGVTDAE